MCCCALRPSWKCDFLSVLSSWVYRVSSEMICEVRFSAMSSCCPA
uniref:Uncharacterized protein n=1 Tax=Anguilla anguilla TaxID=7936 RepID=A0A0E9RCE8_ANGAN